MQDLANLSGQNCILGMGEEPIEQPRSGKKIASTTTSGQELAESSASARLHSTVVVRLNNETPRTEGVQMEMGHDNSHMSIQQVETSGVVDISNTEWDGLNLADVDHMNMDEISRQHDNLLSLAFNYEGDEADQIFQTVFNSELQSLEPEKE